MGSGDEIIATGLARGARARGKRIAFGDGSIKWSQWCKHIFENNPNIAPPGSEYTARDLEWINHVRGHRLYHRQPNIYNQSWQWNYKFKVVPGEFFFSDEERKAALDAVPGDPFVVIEPNLPWWKSIAPNKDWGEKKYLEVARAIKDLGVDVVQFMHQDSKRVLPGANLIPTPRFRLAIAALSHAVLYIGPDGGMHHAAAAVSVPAIIIFGGWSPPSVLGYDNAINLTGDSKNACGSLAPCAHCKQAMDSITSAEVLQHARNMVQR